jgi:hypothetical protein
MLVAAGTTKAPPIDACCEERSDPAPTDPSAEMLRHIPKEGVRDDNQEQHSWDK